MYPHSIEIRLALLTPNYGRAHADALSVLNDSRENMMHNGGLSGDELPDFLHLAAAFHEFYEGAIGAYTTHTLFGPNTFAGIQQVASVAETINWVELQDRLDRTRERLKNYPGDVLEQHVRDISATDEQYAELLTVLVEDFEEVVRRDVADNHQMRRRAHLWAANQLDSDKCDDAEAVPLLPATKESARNLLGLDLPKMSLEEWRESTATWRSNRKK